jgi:Zn-dependent protease with chaperone function
MKDFFHSQETARRKTGQLIFLFTLAVILIVVCVYVITSGIFFLTISFDLDSVETLNIWDAERFVIISLPALLLILGGSLYKVNQLGSGGYRVAEMMGGRLVASGTREPEEKKLLNVVEEMAIASGVPVPGVYVMDKEGGINAFAAGCNIEDSVICVTKGSLSLLSRDELQGVIAHEFSHILNGDTSINISLMGWLHGILVISLIGEGLLRGVRWSRGRGSMPFAVLGIALYILGYLGVFFGKLIKSAVSRQREYLADASAVQFTRNPSGLAGVLKKIWGLVKGSVISHPRVSEASHMYFCSGLQESWFAMMATHPPLVDRILKLDPHFDGVFPKVQPLSVAAEEVVRHVKPVPRPKTVVLPVITGAAAMAILETVGAPVKEHTELVRRLFGELPEAVRNAARDSLGACALIYVLLLGKNEKIREEQQDMIKSSETPGIAAETEKLAGYLPWIEPRMRLPLVDLAIPALRSLSARQYSEFKDNINRLIEADQKLSLFEYVLRHVLVRNLDAHFLKPGKKVVQIYSARGAARECSYVLSMLAHLGQRSVFWVNWIKCLPHWL